MIENTAMLPNSQSLLTNLFHANASVNALDTQFEIEDENAKNHITAFTSNCCDCRGPQQG